MPYPPGTYREAWSHYPVLVRQYRPEHNRGVLLTQVPPAADVWLSWLCDAGHVFVATPDEQRHRPGRERRRSAWCPWCSALADPRRTPALPMDPGRKARTPGAVPARAAAGAARPARPARSSGRSSAAGGPCSRTPDLPVGEPFASACAPPPASAAEERLRADLAAALTFTPGLNAVRLGTPFFDHLEAWPDIVLPELRVAVEYDSTGRHGLEHVGHRETADRRKDRALRRAGWEVVRLRTGRLQPLGPHDLVLSGLGRTTVLRLLDAFREIRGALYVDAWLR